MVGKKEPDPATTLMCPCYKILTRKGVLSTTGHSTNFVVTFEVRALFTNIWSVCAHVRIAFQLRSAQRFLTGCAQVPTNVDPNHWIKRGVALFLALAY